MTKHVVVVSIGGKILFRVQQIEAREDDLVGIHQNRIGFDRP